MAANVTKLIQSLKKRYPELQDEPMLDELEAAGADDGEDEPMDEADLDAAEPGDEQVEEAEPEDGDFSMPDLEKEADLMSEEEIEENEGVPGKPKRKAKKPADDDADEPTWIQGKY